jgi:SAM-dependent methyltransferase
MSESLVSNRINHEVRGYTSALDVGSGPGRFLNNLPVDRKFAVEACVKYVPEIRAEGIFVGRAETHLPAMPNCFVDVVFALDFIEHLEKESSLSLIRQMQRVAKHKVVLFTPHGFHPQSKDEPNPGRYTDEEWEYQTHRSSWEPEDLKALGFSTESIEFDYGKGTGMERALWAVWRR